MFLRSLALAGLSLVALPVFGSTIVTGITLSGSYANPTITVQGSGFDTEPSPAGIQPSQVVSGPYTGSNYGPTALSFHDLTYPFNAGQSYSNMASDAIGLLVSTYTDSEIVFTLGSAYTQSYVHGGYSISPGDLLTAEVNNTTSAAQPASIVVTPEPGSLALLGTGMLLPLFARLRRRG